MGREVTLPVQCAFHYCGHRDINGPVAFTWMDGKRIPAHQRCLDRFMADNVQRPRHYPAFPDRNR